jgi:MFS superfamily sulfate permease-like transporter
LSDAESLSASTQQQSFEPQSTADVGLIVGIVVGILLLCILLAVLVIALDRERRRRREAPQSTQLSSTDSAVLSSPPTSSLYGKAPGLPDADPQISMYDSPRGDANVYESPESALN